jgi:hypothetical protein
MAKGTIYEELQPHPSRRYSGRHCCITLQPTAPDSFTAHLDPKTFGLVIFRWKLDERSWQQGNEANLALDHLPNGAHNLSVLAMTHDLNVQAAPTVATFETKIDALIAQLHDPDYDRRKAAVEELARQPNRAIPALQKPVGRSTPMKNGGSTLRCRRLSRHSPIECCNNAGPGGECDP